MRTRGPIAFPTSFPPCARAAVQADKTMAMRSDVILTLITQTVEEFLMWLQWEVQFITIAFEFIIFIICAPRGPRGP